MANRFWVGGTDTWNATAGTKWATTSGGAGGASVPTSADDVFFDANSPGVCTTSGSLAVCKSFNSTGQAGSMGTNNVVTVHGNVTLGKPIGRAVVVAASTITSNGNTFGLSLLSLQVNAPGATVMLADNFFAPDGRIELIAGTFDANNKNIDCGGFLSSNTNVRSVIMGSGTWTCDGFYSKVWDTSVATNLTVSKGTSTLVAPAQTRDKELDAGGVELNNVTMNVRDGYDLTFNSALICNNLTVTWNNPKNVGGTLHLLADVTVKGDLACTRADADSGTAVLKLAATSGTKSVTWPNYASAFDHPIVFDGAGGTWRCDGELNQASGKSLTLTRGTLDLNDLDHTVGAFSSSNTNTRAIDLGTGTLTLAGTGWDTGTTTGLTVTPGTSTVKLAGAGAQSFAGGGKTFNNIWIASVGTAAITGSNTFNDVKLEPDTVATFAAGSTQTVASITSLGSAGHEPALQSSSPGSAWNIAKAAGTVDALFVELDDSHAGGGATFNATDSIDGGGNTGWNFVFAGFDAISRGMSAAAAIGTIVLGVAAAAPNFSDGAAPPTTVLAQRGEAVGGTVATSEGDGFVGRGSVSRAGASAVAQANPLSDGIAAASSVASGVTSGGATSVRDGAASGGAVSLAPGTASIDRSAVAHGFSTGDAAGGGILIEGDAAAGAGSMVTATADVVASLDATSAGSSLAFAAGVGIVLQPTPAARIFTATAEHRVAFALGPTLESRTFTVPATSRDHGVERQDQTITS